MIDYLEPLLRTPDALAQAVAALGDGAGRPQRQEPFTEDGEQVLPMEVPAEIGADWPEEQGENWDALSSVDQDAGAAALEAQLDGYGTGLPLFQALTQVEAAVSRSAALEQAGTAGQSFSLPAPWMAPETPAADAKAVDLAFQRDSRRYDNGFSLY